MRPTENLDFAVSTKFSQKAHMNEVYETNRYISYLQLRYITV